MAIRYTQDGVYVA